MSTGSFLCVNGLSKSYKELRAVDGVSFQAEKGGVFGLLGPNGAGKTTLIKMLCGLLKADAGTISLGGVSIRDNYRKLKAMIGLCPQDIVVWELLTCFEQLKMMGVFYGLSHRDAGRRAALLLEMLGLSEKSGKPARTLSGGMLRRLNITLALVHDPQLVILDEPQAGLDPQSRVLVRDCIRQLAGDKAVILTTHDMDEADRLSDTIAIIDHGRLLAIGTPEQIKRGSCGAAGSDPVDVLQVRSGGLTDGLAARILERLPPDFTEKKYTDGLFLLSAPELLEKIGLVSRIFREQEVVIEDMTVRKRTLEDAFIAMTGRGLRE